MAEVISPVIRAETLRVFSFPFEAILSVICELSQFDKLAQNPTFSEQNHEGLAGTGTTMLL